MSRQEAIETIETPAVLKAFEMSYYDTLSKEIQEEYSAEYAIRNNIVLTLKEAREVGRREELKERMRIIATKMLDAGINIKEIQKITELSIQEIEMLQSGDNS